MMQSAQERRSDEQRARLASGVAAYAMGADEGEILLAKRANAAAAAARHMAMYLTHIVFGMSYGRVAAAFGRDRSTVAYAARRMEEWREDSRVDLWVQAQERVLREAPAPDAPPFLKELG